MEDIPGLDPSLARKGKKKKGGEPRITPQQKNRQEAQHLLDVLRGQLELAKQNKEHKIADTLRKQLWVVRDIAHGVKPDMPEDMLREILSSLPISLPGEEEAEHQKNGSTMTPTERKIKKLKEKLEQIEKLKIKQANGEKLEDNQIKKIDNEDSIKKELEDLEKIMAELEV